MPDFTAPGELIDLALSVLDEAVSPLAAKPAPVAAPIARSLPAAPSRTGTGLVSPRRLRDTRAPVSPRISTNRVLQEAARLAADREIGNSNAIDLLALPHTPADLKQVIRVFDRQLTREARAKLALGAYAPLPAGVENQRYEPIFDRYPVSGRTYTTAHGAVVLDEVQYYNGEMVQVYGECANLADVRAGLAGSGYRPLTLKYDDGRETAAAQFWAHHLSDTSLRPYNAAFLIVVAVPDDASTEESSIKAAGGGAASVLAMLRGAHDSERRLYTNQARLYYHRLLDSTQVAIDVGRERMGTDKRPGVIDRSRSGSRLVFSVRDGVGRGVAAIDAALTDDPDACGALLAAAADKAGITRWHVPPGTECVFPGVARIGSSPVVLWDWRTDVQPRLQPVTPTTIVVDPGSDEGATLARWGFKPAILGHLPNVRGVVTGVPAVSSK